MTSPHRADGRRRSSTVWIVALVAVVCALAVVRGIVHGSSGNDSGTGGSSTLGTARAPSGSPSIRDGQVMPTGRRTDLDAAGQALVNRTSWSTVVTDRFDGSALNRNHWSLYYPWGARTNAANGEYQWYQASNVTVAGGRLTLTARRESPAIMRSVTGTGRRTFPYTSGMVTTHGRLQADVGGVDVRARSTRGAALWPAIWLLPADGGYPPEFDVFETYGASLDVYQTAHYDGGDKKDVIVDGVDPTRGFHTYSARWDRSRVVFMVDGLVTLEVPRSDSASPLYLLLDLAVGSHYLGAPSALTPNTAAFRIDSVVFMSGDG